MPELCKSYTPGKTDQDIHVRLARLEQIIETALPHYWSQGNATPGSESGDRRRSMSPMDDGNHSQPEDEDPNGGMFESGRWYGKSASGLVAAPAVLEQVRVHWRSCAMESRLNALPAAKYGAHPDCGEQWREQSVFLASVERRYFQDGPKAHFRTYGTDRH